jgi:hypothetical protein
MWPFSKKSPGAEPPAKSEPPGPPPSFATTCALDLGKGPLPAFPLLMAEDWKRAPTQVARPIIVGPKLPHIPFVAVVHLIPEPSGNPNRVFIRTERVESIGKTVADFEKEALHNLSLRPASWKLESPVPTVKIATCTDDYLAAERILDPAFLAKGQALLGSKNLLVGIPGRHRLYATALDAVMTDKTALLAFKLLNESEFATSGDAKITPQLFMVLDGKINSIAEIAPG